MNELSIWEKARRLFGAKGEVAQAGQALDTAVPASMPPRPPTIVVKPADVVAAVQAASPELLAGIPEKRAALLMRATAQAINQLVEGSETAPVRIVGLGLFTPTMGSKIVDGVPVPVKRIAFKTWLPRA